MISRSSRTLATSDTLVIVVSERIFFEDAFWETKRGSCCSQLGPIIGEWLGLGWAAGHGPFSFRLSKLGMDTVLAHSSVGMAPMGRSRDLNFDLLSRFGPPFFGVKTTSKCEHSSSPDKSRSGSTQHACLFDTSCFNNVLLT